MEQDGPRIPAARWILLASSERSYPWSQLLLGSSISPWKGCPCWSRRLLLERQGLMLLGADLEFSGCSRFCS